MNSQRDLQLKANKKAMNKHIKNLNKIEFVVTDACTGKCKHCSEGDHESCGEHIDPQTAADAVRKVAAECDIKTVMAFGGEPLLYTDAVYAIMTAAKEMNIPRRQVITNGYFSKNAEKIRFVVEQLAACGVNDLLLSVDAFHQETIPISPVFEFVRAAASFGIPTRLQPAWLGGREADNHYNRRTKEILASFSDLNVPTSEGNRVFFEGNAPKYLPEYFENEVVENPYREDPCNVKCISFSPNGDVLGGNVYKNNILDLIRQYVP